MEAISCVGCGTIGSSWASLFAWKGYKVKVYDVNINFKEITKTTWTILKVLQEIEGEKEDIENALDRITFSETLEDAVSDVWYVQESVIEDYKIKTSLFKKMDEFSAPETILATSTSGLRISEIQKAAKNYPERCITVHPFNPPHLIPLAEVVPGKLTNEATVKKTLSFMEVLGKKPVLVKKDIPGMIANRLTAALWREAIDLVCSGVATPEEIDIAVKYGPGLRWAVTGVFLTYHLGGGPGGMRHFLESLRESFKLRWRDLAKWSDYPQGSFERILEQMDNYKTLKKFTYEELTRWRDEKIARILKLVSDDP